MKNQNVKLTDIDSIDILRIISERKWVILLCMGIALIGAYIATTFFISPSYCAVTKVLIQKEKLDSKNVLPLYEHDGIYIKNQAQIISSRPIIESALKSLQDTGDYEYSVHISSEDITAIQENITVDVLRNTSVIEMKVEYGDKDLVAPIANAITAAYVDAQYQNKKLLINDALRAVDDEVETAQMQLNNAEKLNEEFLIESGIGILPESEIVLSLRQFSSFDVEVIKASSELESINTKLSELNKAIEKADPEDLALPFLLNNVALLDIKEKHRIAEIALADLLVSYTEDHPQVLSMKMAINQLKTNLAKESKKIIKAEVESIKIERESLQSKIVVLSEQMQIQSNDLQDVLSSQPKSARLLSIVKAKRDMVKDLLRDKGELKIYSKRMQATPDIVVLESALTPEKPVSPNLLINLFLSGLCGLTIGSAIVIMLPVSEKGDVSSQRGYDQTGEKRSSTRSKTSNKITYTVIGEDDKQHTCWSKDIGRSGLKIISEEALKKNSILKFKIHRDKVKPIQGNGVVVWSSPVSDKIKDAGFVAGIKFYDVELDVDKNEA